MKALIGVFAVANKGKNKEEVLDDKKEENDGIEKDKDNGKVKCRIKEQDHENVNIPKTVLGAVSGRDNPIVADDWSPAVKVTASQQCDLPWISVGVRVHAVNNSHVSGCKL